MEIAVSKKNPTSGKTHKFYLTFWIKYFWPALLNLVQQPEHKTGKTIYVCGQCNSTLPHTKKEVHRWYLADKIAQLYVHHA